MSSGPFFSAIVLFKNPSPFPQILFGGFLERSGSELEVTLEGRGVMGSLGEWYLLGWGKGENPTSQEVPLNFLERPVWVGVEGVQQENQLVSLLGSQHRI